MTTIANPPTTIMPASATRPRLAALDRLRGLAVAVMVLDHLLVVTGLGGSFLRESVTRLALPLFAVLAGHLVRRLSWRWAGVAAVGVALPLLVPWIDEPNVLVLLAFGAVAVWGLRRLPVWARWVFLGVMLTRYANGYVDASGAYDAYAVMALMVLGSLVPRPVLVAAGDRLPALLGRAGRFPLSVYVGHLLVLQLWLVLGA